MKKAYVLLWLSLFAAALLIGNLFVGSTAVAPSDVIAALHGTADSTATFIVGETRMPQAVTALLEANGWADIACRKDFGGNDRCVTARRPK